MKMREQHQKTIPYIATQIKESALGRCALAGMIIVVFATDKKIKQPWVA